MSKVKDSIQDVQCYIGNANELLQEVEEYIVDENDDTIVFSLETIPPLLQIVWDQLKETVLECRKKRIVVEFPKTWYGRAIEFALLTLRIDLNVPAEIDSPDLVPDRLKEDNA